MTRQQFENYMRSQGLTPGTITAYTRAPENEEVIAVLRRQTGEGNLFAINDPDIVEQAANIIQDMEFNRIGHNRHSSALKKYALALRAEG